jgi:hypothetical protein
VAPAHAHWHGHSHGLVHDSIKRSRDGVDAVLPALGVLGDAVVASAAVVALGLPIADG